MILSMLLLFFCISTANASSEVSLDLEAYVDTELNIERIDNYGTLNIFERPESCFRITSNSSKNIKISFFSQNNWHLVQEKNISKIIPYESIFKSGTRQEKIRTNSDTIEVPYEDFYDQEFEFKLLLYPTESIKNISAGKYSDHITISVTVVG